MRILAFSDVCRWSGYEAIVDREKPDVVALAGDLTSDGLAAFWEEAVEAIPAYQKAKSRLLQQFGVVQVKRALKGALDRGEYKGELVTPDGIYYSKTGNIFDFRDSLDALRDRYRQTAEFLRARKKIHVDKFYDFLRHAGRKTHVLVVKGDHDDDFEGDYLPGEINRIPGCAEISGRTVEVGGVTFLGLGFADTHYLTRLRPLISEFAGRADVVICHAEQRRVPLVSELRPRVIIRGHYGRGRYLVAGVPAVFTQGAHYSVISLDGTVSISQHTWPWLQTHPELEEKLEAFRFKKWPWLAPYVG